MPVKRQCFSPSSALSAAGGLFLIETRHGNNRFSITEKKSAHENLPLEQVGHPPHCYLGLGESDE
jgi:hypothetical protein